jgi:hypothetical protein
MKRYPESSNKPAKFRQVLECGRPGPLSDRPASLALLKLRALIQFAWRRFILSHSPRFAKYRPALRLGTRKVEQRLLGRLAQSQSETMC